ncbi:MAG TPA: class I SAM-dependent methyltransferase, partial [Burkholderiaceae bacterium]|nr:class I SAM-dependent methyltransferase [Burkholderiaceae bacterium]
MRPSSLPEPDADLLAHSAQVQATIVAAIDAAGGWLPFDRLMELALYAPGLGYYAAGATKFGAAARGGDFVTAPELSPLFAQALARQ